MRVLAVDFGTSNTVAALGVDGGAPRLVTIDGSPLVPSSVFLTDEGSLAVGRDADRQARIDPSRYEPNPKRRIDDGFILLGKTALPVTTVIAEVLKRVAGEVRRQLGGEPDQIRLTHPARWGQRRRDHLVAAAKEAGFGADPVLIPEPVAAATHFATLSGSGLRPGQALAVYDLGGGTFDIAVVQRRDQEYEVVAEAGLPDLGGLDFDHAILEHIGVTHAANVDPEAWQRLLHPIDAASRRQSRVLATDVRDGKEALSRYPHVDIALPPPFPDVHLTRAEFEDMIRPNLQRSVDLMARTIGDAGRSPAQLAGVYLVGGSSRIPLVARLIQQGLGVTPTTLDQPETSVVTGALYLPLGHQAPAAAGPVAPPTGTMPPPQQYPSRPQPAVTGYGPPMTGYASGPQPQVTGPPLPSLNVHTAVPPSQVRPLGASPHHPGGPPTGKKPRRGLLVGVGAAVVAVVAVVATTLVLTGGNNGNQGGGGQPTGSAAANGIEAAFTDDVLKDYVRPTFGQIDNCKGGFAGATISNSVTCTYKDGIQISFGKAATADTLTTYRTVVGTLFPTASGARRTAGTWTNGNVDSYSSTGESQEVAALYWDDNRVNVFAIAISTDPGKLNATQLRSWWDERFGK